MLPGKRYAPAVLTEERVLYPRNKLSPGAKPCVVGGKPITEAQAIELRVTTFGTASCSPRAEWIRSPIVMRAASQPLGYGLAAPRNGARSLLAGLQAHIIKWLLFDSRPLTKDNKSLEPPETYLRPSEERQEEALWRACSEVIWRCAGGMNIPQGGEAKAVVALPSDIVYVQHSSYYFQDGVTEKFKTEEGCGALLLLYAAVLSRGCENIKKDLDGKLTYLVSSHVEGSLNVVTLLLTGRATPYLHNGVVYIGDEDHYVNSYFLFKFDIHYYTCGGCHVLLNVDTRSHDDSAGPMRSDDISATPLEKLIHTKYAPT
ncbi:hypothetical protein MSG28_000695 [Choristoneura fumiferana]|uniref:Uncharacterized protein n=1 Tax=Choristoneura fumiferana TaxID=7141 RepID=A0ACC0K1U2_CHOFU|nr:hypothetical protein MSG28_000695 [Choristoneura fumiferana]